jgi:hypothetical protein
MRSIWIVACLIVLVASAIPQRVEAGSGGDPRLRLFLADWMTEARGISGTSGAQFGSWSTNMLGFGYSYSFRDSRFTLMGSVLTGTQRAGTGSWAAGSLLGGSDTIWDSRLMYRIAESDRWSISAGLGWAGYNWSSGFTTRTEAFWSKGWTLNADLRLRLSDRLTGTARIQYSPGNYTRLTSIFGDFTSHGTATMYDMSLRYRIADHWSATLGYRWAQVNAGNVAPCPNCRFEWGGPRLQFQYSF